MRTLQTALLAPALLAAITFLVPARSGLAQQSPPAPTLPAPALNADQPATPQTGALPSNGDVPQSAEASPESLEPEVLTHGPVHEAFAEPVISEPDEELIVNKPPPEMIDEVPPEFMPEGDNVEWIPGYWAWDDEIEDYIWVSGLWRRVPPGQRWVPGHWTQVEGGYTWVAGFWTGAEVADLEYLPYPPETLEQGPNVAAPDDNYFWVPGCWIYQTTTYNYNWQPGYWAPGYDDWCWVPRRYVWTPRGALFCGGYWDYRLPRRGLLFAPVRFWHRGFWGPSYVYRPYYTINPAGLLVSLFLRPGYRHYYFGDYYGPRYRDLGYRPWHLGFNSHRRFSDPLYSFYHSYYRRRGIDFGRRMDGWHNYFDSHPDRRPERTLHVSARDRGRDRDFGRDFARDSRSPIRLANSLTRLSESRDADTPRLRRIDDSQRSRFNEVKQQVRNIERTRSSLESRLRDAGERGRLPGSPPTGDRRPSDDRRGGPPSIADDARPGRGGRDAASPRTGSPRDGTPREGTRREGTRNRLELPRAVQSRITPRERDGASRTTSPSGRSLPGRDGQRPPSLDRGRQGQPPGERIDRGRGPDTAPGLRDRLQQTPRSDRSGQTPRSGSDARVPDLRQRSGQPRQSPSRDAAPGRTSPSPRNVPPSGNLDRGRSGRAQQPAPRQQSPQRRIEPRSSSGESRGRIESRGGATLNRPAQPGSRPQIRSQPQSRPPQVRSQPQTRSQPQIRSQPQSRPQIRSQPQSRPQIRSQPQMRGSSRPQIRSSGPPQIRGRSQGSSRGPSSGRGSSNRGGPSGGRGRR